MNIASDNFYTIQEMWSLLLKHLWMLFREFILDEVSVKMVTLCQIKAMIIDWALGQLTCVSF